MTDIIFNRYKMPCHAYMSALTLCLKDLVRSISQFET